MPTYVYRCEHCGHELEVIQRMSDAPLRECTRCQKETLEKVIQRSPVHFRGDGWLRVRGG